MHKYVIMGVQGCGKGTQAKMLCDDFKLVHISIGDIFRWNIRNCTRLGARVQRIVSAGELVPDEIVIQIVKQRLEEHDWNHGFILDGFPRNAPQAEYFLEGYDIDAVILVDVPDEVVIKRISSRRLCQNCGRDHNLLFNPPARPDVCDSCGGPLAARPDDMPEAIRARLDDYHSQTEPVLDMFRRKDNELVVVVDGTRTPADVQQDIRSQLGLSR
jgi:adenylate kinase